MGASGLAQAKKTQRAGFASCLDLALGGTPRSLPTPQVALIPLCPLLKVNKALPCPTRPSTTLHLDITSTRTSMLSRAGQMPFRPPSRSSCADGLLLRRGAGVARRPSTRRASCGQPFPDAHQALGLRVSPMTCVPGPVHRVGAGGSAACSWPSCRFHPSSAPLTYLWLSCCLPGPLLLHGLITPREWGSGPSPRREDSVVAPQRALGPWAPSPSSPPSWACLLQTPGLCVSGWTMGLPPQAGAKSPVRPAGERAVQAGTRGRGGWQERGPGLPLPLTLHPRSPQLRAHVAWP